MKTKKRITHPIVAATITALMFASAASAQTTGTPGKIAKFKSNTTLGDSAITEDKDGRVGIGTSLPTSKLTVQGVVEALGGFKFPDGTTQTTAFLPNQVVRSLNGLTADVTLAEGANISIVKSGNVLMVAAPNALTRVAHDQTLMGDGTIASPLTAVAREATLLPFTKGVDCIIPNGQSVQECAITTVPPGKRWVIEYVSGGASPSVGQVLTEFSIGVNGPRHHFSPQTIGSDGAFTFLSVSQSTRIYVDAGSELNLKITRRPPLTGILSASITVTGFLVDLP